MLATFESERDRGIALAEAATTLDELDDARTSILGRRAAFSDAQKRLGQLDADARKRVGQVANDARDAINHAFDERRAVLEAQTEDALLERDRIDLSLPARRPSLGSLHPLTLV